MNIPVNELLYNSCLEYIYRGPDIKLSGPLFFALMYRSISFTDKINWKRAGTISCRDLFRIKREVVWISCCWTSLKKVRFVN